MPCARSSLEDRSGQVGPAGGRDAIRRNRHKGIFRKPSPPATSCRVTSANGLPAKRNRDSKYLAGSRRGSSKVRHVECLVWPERHARGNNQAGHNILNLSVSLDPNHFSISWSRITSRIGELKGEERAIRSNINRNDGSKARLRVHDVIALGVEARHIMVFITSVRNRKYPRPLGVDRKQIEIPHIKRSIQLGDRSWNNMALRCRDIDDLLDHAVHADRQHFSMIWFDGVQRTIHCNHAIQSAVWFEVIRTFVLRRMGLQKVAYICDELPLTGGPVYLC